MTNQELFDAVIKHARTQRRKAAVDDGNCRYRGPGDTKCFIGALIPDDKYRLELEGALVRNPKVYEAAGLDPKVSDQLALADDLQSIHDTTSVQNWEFMFAQTAKEHNLVYTAP